MPQITTPEGKIFYTRRGSGNPAIVCIHGAGGTHTHWGYQLRDLARATSIATLDLPGHGRSALPGRSTIPDYAAAIIAWMDAVNIQRAVVAGHSMGGAIAQMLALDYPERVSGLCLVSTGARLRVAPAILEGTVTDVSAAIRMIVDFSYNQTISSEQRARAEGDFARCDPVVYHNDFVACADFDVRDRLAEIQCPTQVVCGTADRMTPPKVSEALRDGIRDAQLTLVPDTSHMLLIEQPAEVTNALCSLIARL